MLKQGDPKYGRIDQNRLEPAVVDFGDPENQNGEQNQAIADEQHSNEKRSVFAFFRGCDRWRFPGKNSVYDSEGAQKRDAGSQEPFESGYHPYKPRARFVNSEFSDGLQGKLGVMQGPEEVR